VIRQVFQLDFKRRSLSARSTTRIPVDAQTVWRDSRGRRAQGLHRSAHLGKSGDEDHRQLGIEILGRRISSMPSMFASAGPPAAHRVSGADQLQRLDTVFGQRASALAVQEAAQQLSHFMVVLGDQDSALDGAHVRPPCFTRVAQRTNDVDVGIQVSGGLVEHPHEQDAAFPAPKVALMRAAM